MLITLFYIELRGKETGYFTPSYSQVWGEMFGPDAPPELLHNLVISDKTV